MAGVTSFGLHGPHTPVPVLCHWTTCLQGMARKWGQHTCWTFPGRTTWARRLPYVRPDNRHPDEEDKPVENTPCRGVWFRGWPCANLRGHERNHQLQPAGSGIPATPTACLRLNLHGEVPSSNLSSRFVPLWADPPACRCPVRPCPTPQLKSSVPITLKTE